MEKSKSELYMERLQKWREEKERKKQELKKKSTNLRKGQKVNEKITERATPVSKPPFPKTTCKPEQCKTANPNRNQKGQLPRPVKPNPVVSSTIKSERPVSAENKSNPVAPVPRSSKKESADKYLHKYEQWKQEKERIKSEKKLMPGTSQNKVKSTENPVKARSRLFDPKTSTKLKEDKENKVKAAQSRFDKTKQKGTKPVTGIKRRHSVATEGPPAKKKPVGILKRKSCIGSIDSDVKGSDYDTDLEGGKQNDKEQNRLCYVENVMRHVTPKTPSRNVRFISPGCTDAKDTAPKALKKTPVKKQELQNWLQMNNRTPSKFRHLLCFEADHQKDPVQDCLRKSTLTVDELSEQANIMEIERQNMEALQKLASMLDECMTLYEAGCPVEAIVPWLDDIYKKIPQARTSVKFYRCKVDVLKSTLDLDAVLQVFEEATINNAEPKPELAKMLTETVKYITDKKVKQAVKTSRSRRRSEVQEENVFVSSTIVYAVGNVTPFSDRKQPPETSRTPKNTQVVTPVRRSTRRSLQNLPESLKEKRKTLTSLDELKDGDDVLFQPNLALEKVLDNAAEV